MLMNTEEKYDGIQSVLGPYKAVPRENNEYVRSLIKSSIHRLRNVWDYMSIDDNYNPFG